MKPGVLRHSQAILFMLGGVLMLVLNDTAAKWLLARYDPLQIAFMRSWLAMPALSVLVWVSGGKAAFRSHSIGVHAVRGMLVLLATLAFFGSLRSLSLAEATSLLFTAPILIVVIAALFLRERVGLRSWASVLLGFAGVLIIVRPGMEAFRPESLQALLAALLYAVMMIGARWIDRRDSLWTMTFHMTLFTGVFSSVSLFRRWPVMAGEDVGLFAVMAVVGTGGAACVSQAFRLAPANLIAPLDYTALLWASLMGWLVWGAVPGWPVYAGAAVIIASGIVLMRARE